MLHKAGEKITKVLGELWSTNSIIMWVNRFWLPITKPKKINKTKKSCVGYSASKLIEQTVYY